MALKLKKLILAAVVLALIGALVFFSGGKQKTKADITSNTYISKDNFTYDNKDLTVTNNATLTVDGQHQFGAVIIDSGSYVKSRI